MTLEDGLLMSTPVRALIEDLEGAEARQADHARLEADRARSGLETDFERWRMTGEASD